MILMVSTYVNGESYYLVNQLGDAGKCACMKRGCIFYSQSLYFDVTINSKELSNIDFLDCMKYYAL